MSNEALTYRNCLRIDHDYYHTIYIAYIHSTSQVYMNYAEVSLNKQNESHVLESIRCAVQNMNLFAKLHSRIYILHAGIYNTKTFLKTHLGEINI